MYFQNLIISSKVLGGWDKYISNTRTSGHTKQFTQWGHTRSCRGPVVRGVVVRNWCGHTKTISCHGDRAQKPPAFNVSLLLNTGYLFMCIYIGNKNGQHEYALPIILHDNVYPVTFNLIVKPAHSCQFPFQTSKEVQLPLWGRCTFVVA